MRRARVQITPSALMERNEKKFLTSEKTRDNISELRLTKSCKKEMKKVLDNNQLDVIRYQSCCKRETKTTSKKLKKFLTGRKQHDIIAKLFETNGKAKRSLITEQ